MMNKILGWAGIRRKYTPAPEPYKVYTTAYDQVIATRDYVSQNVCKAETDELVRWALVGFQNQYPALFADLSAQALAAASAVQKTLPAHDVTQISITLLVDHSGSMRGAPQRMIVAIAQCFAEFAIALGVRFEVLGFTTVNWQGKPPRTEYMKKAWAGAASPNPGRLCALRHIIYSDFTETNLPALHPMLHEEVLKENIDGEALDWAASRMNAQNGARNIIILVADGAPVDDSTLSHNHKTILTDHLRAVIKDLQAANFELASVSVGSGVPQFLATGCVLTALDEIAPKFGPFLLKVVGQTPNPNRPPPAPTGSGQW